MFSHPLLCSSLLALTQPNGLSLLKSTLLAPESRFKLASLSTAFLYRPVRCQKIPFERIPGQVVRGDPRRVLHVLGEPANALAVPLSHDNGAHEDLDRSDAIERDLALAGCKAALVFAILMKAIADGHPIHCWKPPDTMENDDLLVWYRPNSCLSCSSLTAFG